MKRRFHVPLRVAAVSATTLVVGMMSVAPAVAAGGDVEVVNTETVQVYTDATGDIETQRIYEQLALTGDGTVEVRNPIATDGLRNLDGFGGFSVEGGNQVAEMTVDGKERLRTVSDYTGDLPLDVQVRYFLDGEPVEPGDVVGESGKLEVKFTVKNVTAVEQEVTFDDGSGGTVTKTVEVPIPMVGSLTTVAPPTFTEVASEQANMAGDGKGGTKLSFTMTLFPPIGSDTAEFGYTANITDGVIPRASISALPVNPLESPSFAAAGASYKGGADTGIQLTDGATQIDENLLKLRDGAGELLAGLIQLRDGAVKLEAGLAGVAAPGAARLADGAGELRDGIVKIDDGAGRLSDGAGQLSAGAARLGDGARKIDEGAGQLEAGTHKASDGAGLLRGGAKKLSTGLDDLADGAFDLNGGATQIAEGQASLLAGLKLLESGVQQLPATVRANLSKNAQYQALIGGMQSVALGLGSPTQLVNPLTGKPTLYAGLGGLKDGLRTPGGFATNDCLVALGGGTPAKCGVADAVQTISSMLTGAANGDVETLVNGAGGVYDYVATTSGGACAPRAAGEKLPPLSALASPHPACVGAAKVAYGLGAPTGTPGMANGGVQAQTLAAAGALASVYGKVDQQMVPGLNALQVGVYNAAADSNCAVGAATSSESDNCGAQQAVAFFAASLPVLVDGISTSIAGTLLENISVPGAGCDPKKPTLICGAGALATGGAELAAGTDKLLAGAGELDAGGLLLATKLAELAAGLSQIDAGAGRLAAGTGQLADGSGELVDGARRLADGAGELAAGTGKAADGAGQVADGAGQLSDGLGDAADGSGQLAEGLGKAAEGAPKIRDGAQRLSDEGTSKLVEAGQSTAQNYGEMYAVIEAGAERAQSEKMVYGAPEGAFGLAAYSYEIKGEDGEGSRNVTRGLGGMAVLAAGAGVFAFRRRFI